MVWGRKDEFRNQSSGDVMMPSEFLAIVKSYRVDGVVDGLEPTHAGLAGSSGGSLAKQRDFRELRLTFVKGLKVRPRDRRYRRCLLPSLQHGSYNRRWQGVLKYLL